MNEISLINILKSRKYGIFKEETTILKLLKYVNMTIIIFITRK